MNTQLIEVTGMTCSACVDHVTKALSALPGIANVNVDLDRKVVSLQFDDASLEVADLVRAIEEEGYAARPY